MSSTYTVASSAPSIPIPVMRRLKVVELERAAVLDKQPQLAGTEYGGQLHGGDAAGRSDF